MQKPKTKNYGGHTYSAVPPEEPAWITIEKGSSQDNNTKTRVTLCVAGLIVVAAACVAAAILWNHFYGAYKAQTTILFAKVGIGTLLGAAAFIGFTLVVAGAIGTAKNVEAHRNVSKEQWGDISERQPLLETKERTSSRNRAHCDLATAETAVITPCTEHNGRGNTKVLHTKSSDNVQFPTVESGSSREQRVSIPVPNVTITITCAAEKVSCDHNTAPGGGKSQHAWKVDDDCMTSHTCMCR